MKERVLILALAAGLSIPISTGAQFASDETIRFVHELPGHNIMENSITCFLQDRQGFIWIGTKNGLFRYDGYRFTSFKMEPKYRNSLSDNTIRSIIEYSRDDLLLIGTDQGGLNIYNKKTGQFSHFLHNDNDATSIGSNTIFDIVEDETGTIWIATIGGGLNRFNIEKKIFKRYFIDADNPETQKRNCIKCLFLDDVNRLWVGTRFCGLYLFDRESETFTTVSDQTDGPDKNLPQDIWCITKDSTGMLWVGTEKQGLYTLRETDRNNFIFEKITKSRGFYNRAVIKIYCDSKGVIWAGTWSGGLYRYNQNTGRFTQYKNDRENPYSISSNLVLAIFEDNAGTLWIGTHAGGINLIQPKKWKFSAYQFNRIKKNTIHINEVRSFLYQEEIGTLWLGTIRGLFRLNTKNGNSVHYRAERGNGQGFLHNAVNAICQGTEPNSLWIGTPVGLSHMNTDTEEFQHYRSSMIDPSAPLNINIIKMIRDVKGILWIGATHIGLIRFDPFRKEFRTYRSPIIDSSAVIPRLTRTLFEEPGGKLLAGTSNGIDRFDKQRERYETFSEDTSLNSILKTGITTIHRDSRDILWIGTSGYGLIKYDAPSETVQCFTTDDGLASNSICCILEDDNGILFISTDRGIMRFNPRTEDVVNFGVEDGLHGTEFRENTCYKAGNGKMYFGGINGYTFFAPEELVKNDFIPPVYITGFSVLNSRYVPEENILYTSSVELNHRMNSFSIEFVALSYINSLKNRYLYKLEGFDREWLESTGNQSITYKNLKPGQYTFRVKGSNNDGIWNEQEDSLSIFIRPPFWNTPAFQIFLSCLIIGITYALIRRRFLLLKKDSDIRRHFTHAMIRNQEFERKRIAAELHDSLGQDLLVIKNQANRTIKKDEKRGKETEPLKQICSIADEAINNIRQISYDLHPHHLEKTGLTDSLKSMISKVDEASEIRFEYIVENIDDSLPKDLEINCYRVVQELLNNIIKHSGSRKAWIKLTRSEQSIFLHVRDDGTGFDYEKVRSGHLGFGLSGVQERIEILKGRLHVESAATKGTNIKIEIPI
jgi:signal transduction histidine kinase/ligand-binding sensor domain-containing protein